MGHRVFTIGHSARSTREFTKCLRANGIEALVDVRHYPGSRFCPQFSKPRLRRTLRRHGISYVHLVDLRGRRKPRKDSKNLGWRSPQFRGCADHMETDEFAVAFSKLIEIAKVKTTVIMCAEAVPWRCHRSLIGDTLLVRGWEVFDIISEKSTRAHRLTSFAKISRRKVTYPRA